MKAMRWTVSLMMLTLSVACSSKNGIATSGGVGSGPTGRNVKAQDCQVGQLYNSDFGCLSSSNQCPQGQGFSRDVNGCIGGSVVTETTALGAATVARLYAPIKIEDSARLADLLRDAGVCGGYMTANADCMNLIRAGAFIIIDAVNLDTANITIGAGTPIPQDLLANVLGQYAFTNTMAQYYVRFSQKATTIPYNVGNGTEIVSRPANAGLSITVPKGNLGSERFDANIFYGNTKIGTADVRRYD